MKLKGKAKRQLMKVTALVMFAAVIVTNTAPLYAEGDENIPPSDEVEVVAEVSEDVTEGDNEEGAENVPAPESSEEDSGESGGAPEEVQEPSQDQSAAPEATEITDNSPEVTEEPQITPEVIVDSAEGPSSEPTSEPAAEPEPTAVPTVELEATAEPVVEPEATAVPDITASPEAAEATPSEEPSVSPSAVPSVTPVVSPSASPSVSPSATPTASVSPTPSASPSASPSATPTASPEKAEAVINSDGYSISGSGLKELTVTFDTADLNDGDSFNLVLSTSADSVSVIGNAFSAKESGRYKIEGLQKNALNITFGNLNEEEFTLTAEGTNVTFICNASDEPVETDEGYAGEASIKAVSEKEAEPEIKLVDKSIMTKTSDGAWVTVAGLLPEGATVTAVPVNVEIEGKVVLAAYDITILDAEGKEYKITETVTVSISAPVLKETEAEEVSVYHMEDENAEAEKVADVGIDYNKVSFGAEGFSIYIVVKDAEGKDVGRTYNLSDTFDLASFAQIEATVSANGSEISSEKDYAVNTTFRLDLKYTLDNTLINALKGEIGNDTEGTVEFVYHMPAEITSAKQAMKGEIRDLSKGVCGTYEIGEDGVVHFRFNKSFIKENSSISGTFEYYFSITDVTTITENKVEFQFPGTASPIVIKVKDADVTGWKDASNTGEKITFTIHLNNGAKACNNVVVTDTPGSNLQIDTGSIVVIKNGNAITEGFTIGAPDSNGVFTITFAHLDPNDKIEISYPASIKDPTPDKNGDGFVDGLVNKASWSVEGQVKGEDDATPWISTAKKGSKSGWVNGQSVSWTVNLNDGTIRNDVSGKEYTDTLTSVNQKYDQNSIKIYADGSDVTSSLKDSVVWNNDDDANPKSFSLTLPADAGTKAYKITYNTVPVTPIDIGGSVEVSNEGSFGGESIGGDKETITRTEQVGVTKTHKESQTIASDGIVEWTSVITPDAGTSGLTNPEFKDFLGWPDQNWYSFGWCGSVFLEDKLSISYNGSSLTAGSDYDVIYSNSSGEAGAVHDTMTIQFKGTYTSPITITYQSKDNGVGAESGNGKTIHNVCKVGNVSAEDSVQYKKGEGATGHGIFKNGRVESDATGDYVWWTIYANATKAADASMPVDDFGGNSITIVDTLPDGLELPNSFNEKDYNWRGWSDGSNGVWGSFFTVEKPQVGPDGKTLTFKVNNVKKEVIKIEFRAKVTKYDEKLINHVSYSKGDEELGSATGEIIVSSELLQKSGEVIGDARTNIQYTIVVNEKEMDYRPDSDYLILEDTIPANVELVNGSVHFDVSEGTSYLYDANTRVLKIQVPDGKKVTVTYEVAPDLEGIKPDGSEYTVSVSNTVILSGSANIKSESKASYKVYEAGATAKGDRDKLTLQKIDAQTTDATLAGATYQLYSVSVPEGNPKFEAEQTTGNDGIISFGGLAFDQIYYYVETAAPSGYILDPVKYYFIYKDQETAYNNAVNTFNQKFPGETLRTSPGGDFVKRTNVKKSVAEITAEKVLEGADIKDHTFQFKLTAVDNSGKVLTGGNVYSETVTADETGKIAFPEIVYESAGTYYYKIEEIRGTEPQITYDDNSYIVTVDVSFNPLTDAMTAMVSYPENKPVVFVNTYQKAGSLKITKTLAGNDVDSDKYFTFNVSLDDESINGTYSDVNFSKGKASITLKGGESKIIEGLPEGMGYTVTETAESSADYEVTSTGTTGTISAESIAEAAFTNTRNTYGNLTVTKTVAGNAADTDKEFSFTVTLSDTSISGTYGGMTFSNGVARFALKHGQSMKAENLPTGVTYTVTEADYTSDGYTITTKTGETGTISKDCNLTAAFTNTRNAKGSLTVSKTLAGNDPDSSKDFTFTIMLDDTTINETYSGVTFTNGKATITLKDGESKVIEELPNGVGYTVTEADYSGDGYVTTVSGVAGESRKAEGTISENATAVAAFTNTKDTYGNLTVTKTVAGNAADKEKKFAFTVTLSDNTITGTYGNMEFQGGVASFTLKHGESKKAENLPTGVTYTVIEEDYASDGYKTTKTGETGKISAGCDLTAAFTNTRNAEGSLTVSKTLAGNDTDSNKDFTFTIKLSDSNFSGTYSGVTFTNGEATITLKGGESKVIEGLPNGVGYTVTEADYSGEGYVTTVSGVAGESRETSGTISENAAAVAAFTNTKDTYGNLTVTKTVAGNAADTDKEFSFTVTLSDTSISGTYGGMTFSNGVANFTLKHGHSMKAENLPTGVTYTVTEADYTSDGYKTTMTGETGKISAGCDLTAAFTNTRNAEGSLTVSKTLAGNNPDSSKDFTFTIMLDDTAINETYSGVTFTNGKATITLKGGESKVIEELPNGVGYTVTEADYSGEGYVTTVSGVTGESRETSGTISENAAAVAEFTNTKDTYGDLTVTKTVAGNAADTDKEFSFTVTLSDKSISGTYGGMTFSNGVARFVLKHGQSMKAENLPTGVTYTVTEADYNSDGYTPAKTGETGKISAGCDLTAAFTNTRNAEGSLTVSKTLAGNNPDSSKDFTFTIMLDDTTINETYSGVTFTNGKATITLKGGESKVIEGLPNGVGYTVTEADYSRDGYKTTVSGVTGESRETSGTISENAAAVAEFTNTKDTYGNLTVTKTVAGNAADTDKEFSFTVTLSDTSISGTYGGMTFSNGVARFVLKHGQSMKAENLPTGVTYTVTEADYTSDGYIPDKTEEKGKISAGCDLTAAFTNTRNAEGSLTVSKTLAGNDAGDDKAFTFTIKLSDSNFSGTYSGVTFTNGEASITLKGGENKVIEGLPNGIGYTVTEADYSGEGYVTTVSGVTGESRETSGTISENAAAVAEFTNTKDTYGNLTVTKTVAGNAADTDKEFSFTVTLSDKSISGTYGGMTFSNGVARFALKHGESMKAENLPTGVTYTVTEGDYTSDGYIPDKTEETGKISAGCDLTAAFTNTRNTEGSLTVSKTLAGNDTDSSKDFTFTIKLDDTTINETYSDVTFTNGEATITLKGGESKVIEGLPNGVGYTVTEADYSGEGYVTTVSGATGTNNQAGGTISGDTAAVAAFTNTRNTNGNLTVTKTVTGNAPDADKEFSFTVTLSDTSISGTYGGMTFSDGIAVFTLKHGESKTAENLPTGVTYTVTEADYTAEGFVTTKSGETGIISEGCALEASFINTYTPVSVSVSGKKTWDDNDNEYGKRPESITINLLADGKVVESKSVTKDDNWAWSFTDLPKYDENGKEIVYTISEEKVKRYTADVSGFNVTNKYTPDEAEVKVTKVWEDNNDKEHIRPAKIMVQLYEDRFFDKEVEAPVELSADNNWTYTWKGLPRTKLFGEIDYSVKELGAVDEKGNIIDMLDLGYTCTVSEDTDNNIVITNRYTPKEEPTPTPIVSPSTTPTVSPSTTPTATPDTVPTATPDEMPTATPEATPETTPESTPEATPETTPVSTPETTPESSPAPSETPEAPETPSDTPAPEEEPENPGNGPERTPDSRPDNTPVPTPARQVLGAERLRIRASQGAVLGARRGIDCAVLGKRRRPGTGDNANIMVWVLMMSAAMGGAITSIIMLITGRRSKSR